MRFPQHAASLDGRGFASIHECAGSGRPRSARVTFQRQTRKTTISPNSSSMSDSRRSVDTTEVGQAKPSGNAERVLSRVFRIILVIAAVAYFVVAGVYVALRYFVLPQVDSFRPRVEQLVS